MICPYVRSIKFVGGEERAIGRAIRNIMIEIILFDWDVSVLAHLSNIRYEMFMYIKFQVCWGIKTNWLGPDRAC